MLAQTDAPQGTSATRWRIALSDRADLVISLRDYFRRMGLSAKVIGPTVVTFTTEMQAEEIEEFVDSWVTGNGLELHVEQTPASPLLVPIEIGPEATPRLGGLLIKKGYITDEQLASSLTEARAADELLGVVLLRDGLLYEDELARTLSEQLSIPYISIMRIGIDHAVARLLPADVGAAAAAIPVRFVGQGVQVVFADPTDQRALSAVRRYLPNIEVAVAELSDIRLAWRGLEQSEKAPLSSTR